MLCLKGAECVLSLVAEFISPEKCTLSAIIVGKSVKCIHSATRFFGVPIVDSRSSQCVVPTFQPKTGQEGGLFRALGWGFRVLRQNTSKLSSIGAQYTIIRNPQNSIYPYIGAFCLGTPLQEPYSTCEGLYTKVFCLGISSP